MVERPRLPTLQIGEGGIIQDGLIEQSRFQNNLYFGPNHYELIENGRYGQIKELLGYMGIKTQEYYLFKVINKDTEIGEVYINCGFDQPVDIDGTIYSPDIGSGGNSFERFDQQIVSSGKWLPVYQTARSMGESGSGTISWNIDVSANTFYKIKLRFADFWDSQQTQDIHINGWERKKDFSIIKRTGKAFERTDLNLRVPVTQNKIELSVRGRGHLNAIDVLRLEKGDVDLIEASRDDQVTNKDIFLFVNKNIDLAVGGLKKKFLEIQNSILKNRYSFFF